MEIVLTDFGLAGSDLKGGTPIFASPECLANSDRKNKSTDIFSFGRVSLFLILPKAKFLEFLFVPLTKGGKDNIIKLVEREPILNLISKMMRISNRIDLKTLKKELQSRMKFSITSTVIEISKIIQESITENTTEYIDVLRRFS